MMSNGERLSPAQIVEVLSRYKNAIAIYTGHDIFIEAANDAMIGFWGKDRSVIGKCLIDAVPELKGQPFIAMLQKVLATGTDDIGRGIRAELKVDGRLQTFYFDYEYLGVKDENGHPYCILHTAEDVTERELGRQVLDFRRTEMLEAKAEAETQHERLTSFFMQAPAGICILNGPELVFELINPLYQQLFPGRELLGKPLLEAVPEVKGQAIWNILQDVYTTGKTFEGNELLIPLASTDDRPVEDRYFNFIYQAKKNRDGHADGILVFVFEVTGMVLARQELKKAQDLLELAISASAIGIWTADLATGRLFLAPRTRVIHGIPDEKEPTLTEAFAMISEQDRDRVMNSIDLAVANQESFYDEYLLNPMDGGKPKWLRSNGRAYYDDQGKALYVTGAIFDITEQKEDDARKNDFIGMVSHELKTPLTSLSAYIQMLQVRAKKTDDNFISGALDQSIKQVRRMTTMINGFLNISRLESGKINIDKKRFDMADLVKESEEETVALYRPHQIIFHPVEPTHVNADRDKIGQVVSNLISNAVKYSRSGSTVEVSCEAVGGFAKVCVSDEGIGIGKADIELIFERYYRVKNYSNVSGFGIGLYLSAEIVTRHQGKIWAESEVGKGSTFYFTLPLDADQASSA